MGIKLNLQIQKRQSHKWIDFLLMQVKQERDTQGKSTKGRGSSNTVPQPMVVAMAVEAAVSAAAPLAMAMGTTTQAAVIPATQAEVAAATTVVVVAAAMTAEVVAAVAATAEADDTHSTPTY